MGRIEHFVLGRQIEPWGPLARYIEPIPAGVATAYIEAYTEPGEIVLTPFCQSESIVHEAVEAGRKAIATNFNPVAILPLRCRMNWPDRSQLDAAVTELGDTPKHGVSLREDLNGLYATICPQCQRPVVADYFIWEQEEPVEKGYRCQACGSGGTATIQAADLELLKNIEKRGLHYWYILDRLAPLGDESRERAQKLLDLYTPRNLYALATLLIEIENLFADSPLQETMKLLLLHCLDTCSVLNPSPPVGADRPVAPRPKRLRRPRRFFERNVWQAFEEAYMEMRRRSPLPSVRLAEHPEEIVAPDLLAWAGGELPNVLVKAWSVRHLVRKLPDESISLIIAVPPRLDPAFWALSYLWSGWLFGREVAAPLKPLLKRGRSDWPWYRRAMEAAFGALRRPLRGEGHLVLAFSTEELAPMEALLLAAEGVGFKTESLLHRADGEYQLSFIKETGKGALALPDKEALAREIRTQALAATKEALRKRGEPLTFPRLHNAICRHLSQSGLLRQVTTVEEEGFSPLDFVAQGMKTALESEGLLRLDELWWLRRPGEVAPPLADRVERAVHKVLSREPTISCEALLKEIYVLFPGLLTPEVELIDACLASYGLEITPGYWQLRAEDQKENREHQRGEIIAQLMELGRRLEYEIRPGEEVFDILWCERGETMHAFVVSWTAILGSILGRGAGEFNRYLVIPGERSPLVSFKLEHDPRLRRAAAGWQFIKCRHLADLLQMEEVDRHDLKRVIGLEPIIEKPEAQIPLL